MAGVYANNIWSSAGSDFVPDYTGGEQKGFFIDNSGVVQFKAALQFNANNYTTSPGNLYFDLSGMIAKLKGNLPNGEMAFWQVDVGRCEGFNLNPATIETFAYVQSGRSFARLWQLLPHPATPDAIGTAEMSPGQTGLKLSIKGMFKY